MDGLDVLFVAISAVPASTQVASEVRSRPWRLGALGLGAFISPGLTPYLDAPGVRTVRWPFGTLFWPGILFEVLLSAVFVPIRVVCGGQGLSISAVCSHSF